MGLKIEFLPHITLYEEKFIFMATVPRFLRNNGNNLISLSFIANITQPVDSILFSKKHKKTMSSKK